MATPVHLHIPEPCHENWQQMTPNEQGRHCMACQKTVVDFTLMSDQEILDHISRATASVCGRFNNDQLNKTYAEKKLKPSFTFRYAWNMLVSAFLLTGSGATAQASRPLQGKVAASASAPPLKKKTIKKSPVAKKYQVLEVTNMPLTGLVSVEPRGVELPRQPISGIVKDNSTKQPVSFVSVRIKGTETGVSTDVLGNFVLSGTDHRKKITLVVSGIGYATQEYEVDAQQSKPVEVFLSPEYKELAPVEVKSYPVCTRTVMGGAVAIIKRVTITEKIKRELGDWLPGKKDVQVYPNPTVPGNSINIQLNLKVTGEYKLELIDASGRIVHVQALQVVQKEQVVNMPTQSSWSRGVYWMRISNNRDKKIHQAKVLLQ